MSSKLWKCPANHTVLCDENSEYRKTGGEFAAIHPCVTSDNICRKPIRQVKSKYVNRCHQYSSKKLARDLGAGADCDQDFAQRASGLLSASPDQVSPKKPSKSVKTSKTSKASPKKPSSPGFMKQLSGIIGNVGKDMFGDFGSSPASTQSRATSAVSQTAATAADMAQGAAIGAAGAAAIFGTILASGKVAVEALESSEQRINTSNVVFEEMVNNLTRCTRCREHFDHTTHLPFNVVCLGCGASMIVCLSCMSGPTTSKSKSKNKSSSPGVFSWIKGIGKDVAENVAEAVKAEKYDLVADGQGILETSFRHEKCANKTGLAVLSMHSLLLSAQVQHPSIRDQIMSMLQDIGGSWKRAKGHVMTMAKYAVLEQMKGMGK